ncbi:MAG TPA: hypothetical protein VJ925_07710 [Longimicrobiales bacterium]|nr:hypothetical protein [Longimicrobiales bacterium]
MRSPFLCICLVFTVGFVGCSGDPTGSGPDRIDPLPDADLRILFVGNSLTFTNDLPALFATVVEASGRSIAYATVALPDFSLEDHWNTRIADVISGLQADIVVLQQGPSSLPQNRTHLRSWTETLTGPIRAAGGDPALYMVWPESTRLEAFDAVLESYRAAAVAVGGTFIPGGETWRAIWDRDSSVALYGPDGFHPSRIGSIAVALTMYATLTETTASGLPARLVPTSSDLPLIDLPAPTARTLYAAVDETVARFR